MIQKILFTLPPEVAHHCALKMLQMAHAFRLTKIFPRFHQPCNVMGLEFENPVGLAAGFDKNGDTIQALSALGFGFIEVGTVTPKPQAGNPKPRLFRLPKHAALINRMGFNNKGVDYLVEQLKQSTYRGILGVNIGKNRETTLENAPLDYLDCFEKVYPYASYVTVNISSPNTPALRDLQHGNALRELLQELKRSQQTLMQTHQKYVPLVVKISPDLTAAELFSIAEILLAEKIDGIIATNTTLSRPSDFQQEIAGGLSGKPLSRLSTAAIRNLQTVLQGAVPIIACGGIFTAEDVQEKISAGASLVQIYTSLVYAGPFIMRQLMNEKK